MFHYPPGVWECGDTRSFVFHWYFTSEHTCKTKHDERDAHQTETPVWHCDQDDQQQDDCLQDMDKKYSEEIHKREQLTRIGPLQGTRERSTVEATKSPNCLAPSFLVWLITITFSVLHPLFITSKSKTAEKKTSPSVSSRRTLRQTSV